MTASPFRPKAHGEQRPPDLAEARRALALLCDPAAGVMLQGLPSGRWRVLPAADLDGCCAWLAEIGDESFYFTLNPVPSDLDRPARVGDVLRRRWLLVDVDRRKGPGTADLSSTAEEKAAAVEVAGQARRWLAAGGWPEPVQVDSGNGWHLLYRVDLANDADARTLARDCLKALAARFGSDAVEIDTKVHDARRVSKLPGCWARKGPHTAERPHRPCRLHAAPEAVQAVPVELLRALAAQAGEQAAAPAPEAAPAEPKANGAARRSPFRAKASDGASVRERAAAYLDTVEPSVSGQRGHDAALNAARAVVWGFDLGADAGFDLLWERWNPRCLPPWREHELRHKCAEADRVPYEKPRGWLRDRPWVNGEANGHAPEPKAKARPKRRRPHRPLAAYQPFPVDALPEPLRSLAVEGAKALSPGCDPAFVALPALTVCASLIGATRAVGLKRRWTEPPVLWSAIVGDSGTLKSPALALAVDPLFEVQRRLAAEHEAALRAAGKSEGDAPKPVLRRVLCSDATIERLAEMLEESPRGLLLWRDELDAWLQSFRRYKAAGAGSDRPAWLEMHGARALIYDRKTGDKRTVIVPRASVCVTGGIQPGVLASALDDGARESGLAARLLLAWPPRKPKRWTEADVDPRLEGEYRDLLAALADLSFHPERRPGERRPWVVRLSDPARALWIEWYDRWAVEQAGASGDLAAAFAKIEGYAARLALVHWTVARVHEPDGAERSPVGQDSVRAGCTLAEWFANEARRIYAALGETPDEGDDRRLAEWVQAQGGPVTARQLQRSNSRRYPDVGSAEAALEALAEAGLGAWRERPTGDAGGRPTREFVLHPSDAPDERHNPVSPD